MTVRFDHASTAAEVAALMVYPPGRTRLVIEELPNSEYHRCPALSRSGVVRMLRSPLHFHATQEPDPLIPAKAPTPQMAYGSLVHTMALQPALAASTYVVGPEVDTRAAKAWKEALLKLPEGCELVMPLDHRRATAQAAAIQANHHFAEHVSRQFSWPEVSCFWRDTVTQAWLMVRPDSMAIIGVPGDEAIEIIDLKTTVDASPEGFARSCHTFRYDIQAAMYSAGVQIATGMRVSSFLIIASESEFPHACEGYELDHDWISAASNDCRAAIDRFAQCKAVDSWPGYSDGSVQLLRPPKWRAAEIAMSVI